MKQIIYDKLTKNEKIKLVATTKDEEIIHQAFYDQDLDVKLALCQNELLPLGKLKRFTNDKNILLKQKAIEVYERRLIY
ncbi:hypothetical protein OZZ08_08455 [Malaciobacter mytili]|uniref:hypothetical protein n=1 Tax=Malaciobacter mytili TaxID=603050 RepID=UPI00100A353A|nr:hypothetical protein [Malaciobacter mytili]